MKRSRNVLVGFSILLVPLLVAACTEKIPQWEAANPIIPIPDSPLGIDSNLSDLPDPPTPERVRLGRWLFYDARISKDGTISCANCHRPEYAFSEPTPVSTGIDGKKGTRKSPSFINQAWTLYPHFFWDGRAASLEEQALGPVENPVEMGHTINGMISTLDRIQGYKKYFEEAFGSEEITRERVAKAIADYERTRMSGASPWDQWKYGRDENAVSDLVKKGDELFFDKAGCNQCHLGQNFTDSSFHNIGVGWDEETKTFADEGRYLVTNKEQDKGAFKTPTLRDVAKHGPFMHDGSLKTLRDTVEIYDDGGHPNPYLDPKIKELKLTEEEIDALVAFLEALNGEGYMDTAPAAFPQ